MRRANAGQPTPLHYKYKPPGDEKKLHSWPLGLQLPGFCDIANTLEMASPIKNVIIIGAGGHLGPSILSAFDADPYFTVSILARRSSKSAFPTHVKVHRVGDDYPEAELLEAFKGQDAVISTVTATSTVQQKAIIDTAITAGVKRFVPSEFGNDTRNAKAGTILPQFFKGKLETVQYLKEKEKEGLTWTSFVTGPFFDMYVFERVHLRSS